MCYGKLGKEARKQHSELRDSCTAEAEGHGRHSAGELVEGTEHTKALV